MTENRLVERGQMQKKAAWELSAEVRQRRKELGEAVKRGEIDPVRLMAGDALEPIEALVANMKMVTFLRMLPGIGPVKRHEILDAAFVSPEKRLGEMPKERREQIAFIIKGAMKPWQAAIK